MTGFFSVSSVLGEGSKDPTGCSWAGMVTRRELLSVAWDGAMNRVALRIDLADTPVGLRGAWVGEKDRM